MRIHYKQIDDFVENNPNMSWDGWTVLVDIPNNAAWMSTTGVQKDGQWYRRHRIEPNENGFYEFPQKALSLVNSK